MQLYFQHFFVSLLFVFLNLVPLQIAKEAHPLIQIINNKTFREMSAEIKGTYIQKLPEVSGQGRTGNTWRKQEFIIETLDSKYPKKVCIALWGDNVDLLTPMQFGDVLNVSFDIESREYNGRWYTDVRAWRITKETASPAGTPAPAGDNPQNNVAPEPAAPYVDTTSIDGEDSSANDLPF